MIDNELRIHLYNIVNEYGKFEIGQIKRLKSLLMDCSFNKHKKELSSLLCVLNEGCVRELISSDENYNTLHQKLLISLAKNSPMEKEYLSWAIDSWAMALNIIKVTDFANQQLENTKIGLNSNDDSKNNPFFLKCLKLAYSGDKRPNLI